MKHILQNILFSTLYAYCALRAKAKGIRIGRECRIQGVPYIKKKKGSDIILGDKTDLCSSRFFNPTITHPCTLNTKNAEAVIRIGSHCGLSGVVICCAKEITIGDYTQIGAGTLILDRMAHTYSPETGWRSAPTDMAARPIHIGEKCFIGADCYIAAGVSIGNNCVIAAGSVVTKNIPAGHRAFGNPASYEPLPTALGGPEPQEQTAAAPIQRVPANEASSPLQQRVRHLVAETLRVPIAEITLQSCVGEHPRWDSLSHMAIIAALEKEFGLHFPQEELMVADSVEALVSLLENNLPSTKTESRDTARIPPFLLESSIAEAASREPEKTALDFGDERVSYRELVEGMLCAAAVFQEKGLRPGESVVLGAQRRKEFFFTYFGAHLAGLAVVNIDIEISEQRMELIAEAVQPVMSIGVPHAPHPSNYEQFAFQAHPSTSLPDFAADAVADIMFTTGTTGVPKGVPLSHANLAAAAKQINNFIGTTADDIEVLALPICHSFGMGRVRCLLSLGATIVLVNGFSNPGKLFRTMQQQGATGFAFVPAAWAYIQQMSGDAIARFATNLRYIEIGSAPMDIAQRKHLMQLFPHTRICMHYGLTEASRSAFIDFHRDKAHLDSAGRPTPGVEIRIYSENGKLLPTGSEGEICIKGAHVIKSYLHPLPEASHYGDFFRTGDWGMIDSDGFLHVRSRTKDMINVGGKKVSPDEVEQILCTLPGIADAACVATPDPKGVLGEVVKAVLVADGDRSNKLSDDTIRSRVADRTEHYKVPVVIEWRNSLPRTASGKLQRNRV